MSHDWLQSQSGLTHKPISNKLSTNLIWSIRKKITLRWSDRVANEFNLVSKSRLRASMLFMPWISRYVATDLPIFCYFEVEPQLHLSPMPWQCCNMSALRVTSGESPWWFMIGYIYANDLSTAFFHLLRKSLTFKSQLSSGSPKSVLKFYWR